MLVFSPIRLTHNLVDTSHGGHNYYNIIIVQGHDRDWPQLVLGHKRVWAQPCMCTIMWTQSCLSTNVSRYKRVWVQTCVGTNVCGYKRVWAQTRVGTNVSGHKSVWAEMWLGINVCGHSYVVIVLWAQSCKGTNVVEPIRKMNVLEFIITPMHIINVQQKW